MEHSDTIRGVDAATVQAGLDAADSIRWLPRVRVEKFDDDQVAYTVRRLGLAGPPQHRHLARLCTPHEVVEAAGNLLTTAGLQRLTNLMIGAGGQAASNTAARMGVGNSATAEAVGQTDLQAAAGATNRWFQTMDATFPTAVNGVITFKATVGSGDGNFVWNEWGVDIGTPTVTSGTTVNATLLNRKVQSLGTKASGSWVLTSTITIA
jgi:hypothetical protein